jgi:hypothetical protein
MDADRARVHGADVAPLGSFDGAPGPHAGTDLRVQLLITYYQCARAEIIQRVTNRDAYISLFLAAIGAVFSVALARPDQVGLLYVIPAFGLGMSLIYSQHDHMIGAISRFLATEYQDQVQALPIDGAALVHWDLSAERRGLKSGFRIRIATVTVLVTLPQAVAVAVADTRLGLTVISILGTAAGAATILFGVVIQIWTEIKRHRYSDARVDPGVRSRLQTDTTAQPGEPSIHPGSDERDPGLLPRPQPNGRLDRLRPTGDSEEGPSPQQAEAVDKTR